jgi:putative transposase
MICPWGLAEEGQNLWDKSYPKRMQQPSNAPLFKGKYRIPVARLPGWDYGSNASYFITVITHNRVPYFGRLDQDGMHLSLPGQIIEANFEQLPVQFPYAILDAAVVMHDHVHLLITLAKQPIDFQTEAPRVIRQPGEPLAGKHGSMRRNDIPRIVRWFKGRSTYEIRRKHPEFAWQASYYDRILQSENDYQACTDYIDQNPTIHWNRRPQRKEAVPPLLQTQ